MTAITPDILGEAVETAFREQEKTIANLPEGWTILELPPWAKWVVVYPGHGALKAITLDGQMIELTAPFPVAAKASS